MNVLCLCVQCLGVSICVFCECMWHMCICLHMCGTYRFVCMCIMCMCVIIVCFVCVLCGIYKYLWCVNVCRGTYSCTCVGYMHICDVCMYMYMYIPIHGRVDVRGCYLPLPCPVYFFEHGLSLILKLIISAVLAC